MNIADLAGPGRTPACWDKPEVFAASALDYHPNGEEYSHLDLLGHTIVAAAKANAEANAVDVCFGCPLMLACEQIDTENSASPRTQFVVGVIGGRTEAERRARRNGRIPATGTPKTVSVPNPQIAPGDRGPRNQVDDELVARLTTAGKTSDQIARELDCSPRTVSRARKRMGLNTPKRICTDNYTTNLPTSPSEDKFISTDVFTTRVTRNTADNLARTEKAMASTQTTTSPATTNSNPFISGRRISAFMEAVYSHLVTVGGTDHLDTLLAVGMPHVDPTEAIDWWTKHNQVDTEDGTKALRSTKVNTPVATRIREGARGKVFNSISATYRKGRYLDRDGDTYTLKANALTAWTQRMAQRSTTAA